MSEMRVQVEVAPTEDVIRDLVERARAEGADDVIVETTHEAGDAWIRAGFSEVTRVLVGPIASIEQRLGAKRAESYGSIHIQTDDVEAVVRGVRQFVPRLPGRSAGSAVLPPNEGWTTVEDELCDREPEMLRRLARELSDRLGAFVIALGAEQAEVVRYIAFERGRVVDEYLSVPEYYGPLPPGDVIALRANPRLMSRMTGADSEAVRAVARTAGSAGDLPPAHEHLAEVARVFGLRADAGYESARTLPGAIDISR